MPKNNELLTAALKYADQGWKVFPCGPKSKIPLISKAKGGNGVRDATSDKDQITRWWKTCPNANIALACGPDSGTYVVDVDLDEEKGVNGWETLREIAGDGLDMPETVCQDTPRGGRHYVYSTDKPPKNQNNFAPGKCDKKKTGIDIRCDGYYIMLSPSIHPNGKMYKWTGKHAPNQFAMATFPDFMRPELKKAKRTTVLPWSMANNKPVKTSPDKMHVIDRARLYLDRCESAIQGSGGHDALLYAANAMVCGFDLSEGNAISLLWSYFNPRCIPPWDSGKSADVKDFERKIHEAKRTNDKPVGWLLNDDCMAPDLYDKKLLDLGTQIAASLLREHSDTDLSGFEKPDKEEPKHVTKKNVSSKEMLPDFVASKKNRTDCTIPERLLSPPGFVGQLCDWINETAGCYQPLLALGASLVAAGALFGRKVRDQSNGRTNIYAMGVAHSSAGKDHPADCIEQLFSMAGASDLLGGSRVTSDSAIEVGLQSNPVQLYHWDEVGHMFSSISSSGAGNSSYLRTIVPCLMSLYSSPHKLYIGKQKADDSARRIDQPHICVWGLTSPDVLFQGLSSSELKDGWLGRVISFISHDRPKYKITAHTPPPKHLVDTVKAWQARTIEPEEGLGNLASELTCHQLNVPTEKLAMKVFTDYYDKFYKTMLKCDQNGDDSQYLWGKALQNARRVALILATGKNFENPVITEAIALYSCDLIEYTVTAFAESIKDNVADNQWGIEKLRIVNICKKAGKNGVTKSFITRRTQSIKDRRTRDSYIADLVEAEVLDVFGKDDKPHYWVHPLGMQAQMNNQKGD